MYYHIQQRLDKKLFGVDTSDGYECWFRLHKVNKKLGSESATVISTAFVYPRPRYNFSRSKPAMCERAITKVVRGWTWTKHASFKDLGRSRWFKKQESGTVRFKCVMTKLMQDGDSTQNDWIQDRTVALVSKPATPRCVKYQRLARVG